MEDQEKIFLGYEIAKLTTSDSLLKYILHVLADVADIDEFYEDLASLQDRLVEIQATKEIKLERLCES